MDERPAAIVADLMSALSNCALYSADHVSVSMNLDHAIKNMEPYFSSDEGDLSYTVLGESVLVNEQRYSVRTTHMGAFLKKLKRAGMEKVIFRQGLTRQELAAFIAALAKGGGLKSSDHIAVGMIQVRFASEEGEVSSEIEADVEKLREIDEELSSFGRLNTVGLEEVVGSFISTLRQEANVLKVLSPLRAYSSYTFTHTTNVTILAIFQAEAIGITGDLLHEVGLAGLLHDVGKMYVPKEILDKPSKLTDGEWVMMRNHTVFGARYLAGLDDVPKMGVIAAYEHHMRFDGTGYPDSIRRDRRQHLISQIIAVSDFFDALRTERPYRKALNPQVIIGFMREGTGKEFNPVLVENFIRTLGKTGGL